MTVTAGAPSSSARERSRGRLADLLPKWSIPAAFRALRALLVIPSLFAIGSQLLHNGQASLFATFGGFSGVVFSNFGGSRREKLRAYFTLAVAGSVLLTIGTAISSSAALAAPITLVVVFVVIMAGVLGSNAASGTIAVLLSYVLPAASKGAISLVPARLEGWWLAMAAGTIAVMVLSPRSAGDQLRASAARALVAISGTLDAMAARHLDEAELDETRKDCGDFVNAFLRAPSRPIGISRADQSIADLAETVQWTASLVDEVARQEPEPSDFDESDLRLLKASATTFSEGGRLLRGERADLPIAELDSQMRARDEGMPTYSTRPGVSEQSIHFSFHAGMIATAARTAALDALTIARRSAESVIAGVETWSVFASARTGEGRLAQYLSSFSEMLRIHSGLASVTFRNAVRGAFALAAAVAIADLTNVQHGFWVVLGGLSVLRSNAASTGVNAWRAILGSAVGFAVGAAILVGIASNTDALWAIFPVAAAVAAYTPGTAPFAVGQAAFTVALVVVYNLIAPVGWAIGAVRIEDVAMGVGVSVVAGVLFWPRGALTVVREDLADAFHFDGLFLVQSTAWALGRRSAPPAAGNDAARSDLRLSDAMRALMATDQGVRRVPKAEAWRLVAAVGRLRSTARSLGVARHHDAIEDDESVSLLESAVRLAGLCDSYASRIAERAATVAQELSGLAFIASQPQVPPTGYGRWIGEHLDEFRDELNSLEVPVARVAESAKIPWWR